MTLFKCQLCYCSKSFQIASMITGAVTIHFDKVLKLFQHNKVISRKVCIFYPCC